jgi:hypothetical protein
VFPQHVVRFKLTLGLITQQRLVVHRQIPDQFARASTRYWIVGGGGQRRDLHGGGVYGGGTREGSVRGSDSRERCVRESRSRRERVHEGDACTMSEYILSFWSNSV